MLKRWRPCAGLAVAVAVLCGGPAALKAADRPSAITITVPADAEVWFDGKPTVSRGAVRLYESPPLNTERYYGYEVRVRWMANGKAMGQTRMVSFKGGSPVAVDFTKPEPPDGKAPKPPVFTGPTLWDHLGKEENVKRIAHDFVAAALADKAVNFDRGGKYKFDEAKRADLERKLVELASSIGKGPFDYTGKLMKPAHEGMKITDAEFDACVAVLKKALEKNNVQPADVKAVLAAVESKRGDIVEVKAPSKPTTLWDRMGGEENVKRIAHDFVAAALADKAVNFDRGGKYKFDEAKRAGLERKLVELASSIGKGPFEYTGKLMKPAHEGMKITDAEFDACVAVLKKALEKNDVQPADVKAVLAAVESKRGDIVEVKK
jgi:hemoglobin